MQKNNHKSLPTLYPYRQTHTFNLDDKHVIGQTDRQTAITTAHASVYIIYSLDILHVRKEAYGICFHNWTVCLLLADSLFYNLTDHILHQFNYKKIPQNSSFTS